MSALETALHVIIVSLALFLVNWRGATPAVLHLEGDGWEALAAGELLLALFLASVVVLLLHRAGLLREYARSWRRNVLPAVFGAFALLSVFWSVSPLVSLNRWAVFALATVAGSYLGLRLRSHGLLRFLFWYGAGLAILSAAMALLVPNAGRMFFPPYDGAWRGIFWHKNHLGTLMALHSLASLYRLEEAFRVRRTRMLVDGSVYLLQAALVFLSRSATGLLVLVGGGGLAALMYTWHRTRHCLRRAHYAAALAAAGAGLILLFVFSDEVLALLGKEATLTGRLPMWEHLLAVYVPQRPAFGFGMGAFWNPLAVREAIRLAVHWGYAVQIGDNGWLDVLLNLGGAGLGLFVLALLAMLRRGIQRIRQGGEFLDSLPLVFFLAALLANAAFSLFFETESGVWLILVALLFLPLPGEAAHTASAPAPSGGA